MTNTYKRVSAALLSVLLLCMFGSFPMGLVSLFLKELLSLLFWGTNVFALVAHLGEGLCALACSVKVTLPISGSMKTDFLPGWSLVLYSLQVVRADFHHGIPFSLHGSRTQE